MYALTCIPSADPQHYAVVLSNEITKRSSFVRLLLSLIYFLSDEKAALFNFPTE